MTAHPATEFYLCIAYDRVWVNFNGTHGGRMSRPISSLEHFRQFLTSKANEAGMRIEELTVMASSSLDFPDEFTNNPATIALANELRGGVS
jgi:hypothetical protein